MRFHAEDSIPRADTSLNVEFTNKHATEALLALFQYPNGSSRAKNYRNAFRIGIWKWIIHPDLDAVKIYVYLSFV